MMKGSRIVCCVCGLQITKHKQEWTTTGPVTRMVGMDVCCAECGKELDENGMFETETHCDEHGEG